MSEGTETRNKIEAAYKDRSEELLRWAANKTGNREDAEDLLHDAFASTLKSIGRLEHLADPLGWIFASLRNRVIDLWRQRATRRAKGLSMVALETLEEIIAAAGPGQAEELERDELLDALGEALAALPREQRKVIEAQVYQGRTFREISEQTGVPLDTLTARKRYAVKKIASTLRAWYGD